MFMLKSTHETALAAVRKDHAAEVATITRRLGERNEELLVARAAKFKTGAALSEALKERDAARAALAEIAAMETPGSASIGRRMAARARQELPATTGSAPVRKAMETA